MTNSYDLLIHLKETGEILHNKGMEHIMPLENPTFLSDEITYEFYASLYNEVVTTFLAIQKAPYYKGKRSWTDKEREFMPYFMTTFEKLGGIKKKDLYDALAVILKRTSAGIQFELRYKNKPNKEQESKSLPSSDSTVQMMKQSQKEIASEKTTVITTVNGKEENRSHYDSKEDSPRKHVLEQSFDIMKELKGFDLNAFGMQMLQLAEFAHKKQKECDFWKQKCETAKSEMTEYQEMMNNIHRMLDNSPITQQQNKGTRYQTDRSGIVVVDKDSIK